MVTESNQITQRQGNPDVNQKVTVTESNQITVIQGNPNVTQ